MRCTLTLAVLLGLAATAVAADNPNVLLIVADDWGWTDFGFMGHKEVKTPHLDRLGVRWLSIPAGRSSRATRPQSWTHPSLLLCLTNFV